MTQQIEGRPCFTWEEVAHITKGEWLLAPVHDRATGVYDDSRQVAPGALFVAIVGELTDGHRYLEQAAAAGAAAVLVEQPPREEVMMRLGEHGCGCLVTADTLTAFMALAEYHRLRWAQLPVVGITGSCGKTSSKEMCAAVLGQGAPASVLRTLGNTNNFFGVPRNLLRLQQGCRAAVIEMGSNHPGEIRRLAAMVHPTTGLICNIGAAHLEFFGDLQGVAEEKGDLLEALPADGVAVLPAEAAGLDILKRHAGTRRVLTFGCTADSDVRVIGQTHLGDGVFAVEFAAPGLGQEPASLRWRLGGRHQAVNAAGALAVGLLHGISLTAGAAALAELELPGGRMRVETLAGRHWVDDAYNANPTSMLAALDWFDTIATGSRTLILGDMKELGSQTEHEHDRLLAYVCQKFPTSQVVTVGYAMEAPARARGLRNFRTVEECAAEQRESDFLTGEWILLKGSNGVGLSRLVPRT